MANTVDGLVSGMSTSQVISQLMQVEAIPQQQLKTKVSSEQRVVTAFQAVNSKVAALKTAADALTQDTSWKAVKATTSSPALTATATTGSAATEITFDVVDLARAHVVTAVIDDNAAATLAGEVSITIGDGDPVPITVDPENDTAQGVADAINAAGLDVRAAVVTTDKGTVLQLTATATGEAASFVIGGLVATPDVAVAGQDAMLRFGDPLGAGYTVTSTTNTFTNVVAGVTLTATKEEDGVTVSLAPDSAGIADKMQALVDAANAALTEMSKNTAYDSASKRGGPLTGDPTVRALQQKLLGLVSSGAPGYGSYGQFGVELDRSGKLTFDRTEFLAAYDADPAAVKDIVSVGLAQTLEDTAHEASNSTTGTVTLAIQGKNSLVSDLNKRILDWDSRLELKQETLQRRFAALEVALGRMKDQSNWLAGQIAGLPTGG
jgi:flagellar hook-associated protein 2